MVHRRDILLSHPLHRQDEPDVMGLPVLIDTEYGG